MISFDAPSREFCVSRRVDTNTPLQALVTMNDPVYVEASKRYAEEFMNSDNPELGIAEGFKQALFRKPSSEELKELVTLYNLAQDQGHEEPMMVVAGTIFNLDEFLNRN